MAYKFIPQSWKDSEAYNIDHKYNFYINPRNRVFPALTATGITFAKNTIQQNMRGTYYMQTGATTDLTYIYTLSNRFIIEGWFKPLFTYTIGASQKILSFAYPDNMIYYSPVADNFVFTTTPGVDLVTSSITSDSQLQNWIYVRCYFDNIAKLKGFYCTINGVSFSDQQNIPAAGSFTPSNIISFFPGVSAYSSYWIIHELDKTLTSDEYKTYQSDRQIIFEFNGISMGRERVRIPRVYAIGSDIRGVTGFSCKKEKNKSSIASISLLNANGSFSDDQYDIYDPYSGSYNGLQKYLQNKIGIEIESQYSRSGKSQDIPNGSTANYMQYLWETTDGWLPYQGTAVARNGELIITDNTTGSICTIERVTGSTYNRILLIGLYNPGNYTMQWYNGSGWVNMTKIYSNIDFQIWKTINITTTGTTTYFNCNNSPSGYIWRVKSIYIGDGTELIDPMRESLFIGTTEYGAFSRQSPNRYNGSCNISAEDILSEIANTKVDRSYGYDTFDLSKNSDETTSLTHSIARLATKKEIRNYVFNSSGENATPSNSFTNSGGTLTRDNTSVLFGSYALKYVATGAGQYYRQVIKFESNDKLDVGDKFNFSVFINQGTASMVRIKVEELTSAGALVGTESYTDSGTDTGIFTRINVSREIAASTATQLRITVYALGASTFYADGFMLTRGIDPIDYFLLNATDGSSGSGSADSAATYLYDTVAFDFDTVAVTHPYYLVEKGDSPLDHLQDIADASIARGLFVTEDGVLRMPVAYNETNAANLGDIEDAGEISTQLDNTAGNSVEVHGVVVVKETQERILFDGSGIGLATDSGGKLLHPIANGANMAISGTTSFELMYKEDE